jgi:uncharacterized protein (DUF2384 family)
MISQEYFKKVVDYFWGDQRKAWEWFKTPHNSLGGHSPMHLIKINKEKLLTKFIDERIEGKKWYRQI